MQETKGAWRPHRSGVVAATVAVALWRAAAYRWPSSIVDVPAGLRLPFALLGLLFLASGVWAWWSRQNRWTSVFLVYGLAGGVHWGGAIGAPSPGLTMSLFFVYLALTALGDAALLHLALIYPRQEPLPRGAHIVLYGPAVIALLVAGIAGIAPQGLLQPAAGILLLLANLFSMAAGIVFLARLATADRVVRKAARLPLIAAGIVTGSALALLGAGGVLPGEPEAWNLALGAIPICLAVALGSPAREPASGG